MYCIHKSLKSLADMHFLKCYFVISWKALFHGSKIGPRRPYRFFSPKHLTDSVSALSIQERHGDRYGTNLVQVVAITWAIRM